MPKPAFQSRFPGRVVTLPAVLVLLALVFGAWWVRSWVHHDSIVFKVSPDRYVYLSTAESSVIAGTFDLDGASSGLGLPLGYQTLARDTSFPEFAHEPVNRLGILSVRKHPLGRAAGKFSVLVSVPFVFLIGLTLAAVATLLWFRRRRHRRLEREQEVTVAPAQASAP